MKILHVAETAQGGVGTYLAELLPLQARDFGGRNVRALLPDSHAGHVSGAERQMLRRWRRRGRSPLNLLRLAVAVRREIAWFRPDVVHAHSALAGVVVRLIAGRGGPRFRVVYCPHGWAFDRPRRSLFTRLLAWAERALAPRADRIVVISEHERREGLRAGIARERMELVLNGISDVPPVRPAHWTDPRLKVLFVGRLDRQKGFDTLLDAVAPLADRLSVRVAGKAVVGPARPRGNGRLVDYLGWQSLAEVAIGMAAADVVVVPSRWEGFGLVALEAMRGSCAVIASDIGGLPEIVVEGVTGRLVPPDTPERLMEALSRGSREDWARMGRAGRARFLERFTAERMHGELAGLYARLVDGPSAAGAASRPAAAAASRPAVHA